MVRKRSARGYAAQDGDASTPGPEGVALTDLHTLRPGSAIGVGVVGLVAGLLLLVPALIGPERPWKLISIVVLGLVLLWLLVVRPCVQLHDDGVRIINPMRTIDVTWPMITDVRSRWVLELFAGKRKLTAWGVPADPQRPRYGRGLFSMGASKMLAGDKHPPEPPRPKIVAQTVAQEIETRIAADKQRKDGRTPRILGHAWDPAPAALLLSSMAFVAIAFLA